MRCLTCGAILLKAFVRHVGQCPCGARVEVKDEEKKEAGQ